MPHHDYVEVECDAICTNLRFGEIGVWLYRMLLWMPAAFFAGTYAVSRVTKDIYTLVPMFLYFVLLGLWYPLSRLFTNFKQPNEHCSAAGYGLPAYLIYAVSALLVFSSLDDIHWIGVRKTGWMSWINKCVTVALLLGAPVATGNYTFAQTLLSMVIGAAVGLVFSCLLTYRWIHYIRLLESHPVLKYAGYKHKLDFEVTWIL